jgi:predicted lipoprotein with Yx(FWY)xxD motif
MANSGLKRSSTLGTSLCATAALLSVGGLTASTVLADAAGAATRQQSKTLVVSTMQTPLGTFLVSGKTLYTDKASKTRCGSSCLKIWPELLLPKGVKKAKAGSGVNAA